MKELTPDICVIGGGSGGLTVAAGAAAFGVDVVLIEKGKMGGDCLNYGCVPSKAMIAAAKHAHAIAKAPQFGVTAGEPSIDFAAVNAHVHDVIAGIAPHDSVERFEGLGVTVIEDHARFVDPHTVETGAYRIRARRFVVATGSRPFAPPIEGLGEVPYLTNESLFDLTKRPEHLLVVGGGPIGMEMAQAHHRLGSAVTVLEGARALGREDPEMAAIVLDRLRAEGLTILEGAKVETVARKGSGVALTYSSGDGPSATIEASHLLVATGRSPNVSDLGLEAAGIEHDRRGIVAGANLKTSNSRVFVIGDALAGGLQFTHVAGYHAGLVLQQILFRAPAKENRDILPRVTFTDPEMAHVGLTEEAAREKHGSAVDIVSWAYEDNDRARAERRTDGRIKLVVGKRARILGATIVGPNAGEMINLHALAVTNKLSLSDLRAYVSPYPTMSEIGKRAATSYYAPMTRKPLVRNIVAFLRRFG